MKLDWVKIWDEYDKWYMRRIEDSRCECCDRTDYGPDWEEQMKMIQKLANKHLKHRI
jgi:hypothetical protein